MFCFFGCEACGILPSQPGIKPAPPALQGEVLTTGPPEKSLIPVFLPGKFYGQRGLQDYSPWGRKESVDWHATEHASTSSASKDVEQPECSQPAAGCVDRFSQFGDCLPSSNKAKHLTSYDPVVPLLGINPA